MGQYYAYADKEFELMKALEEATARADRRFQYGGQLLYILTLLPLMLLGYYNSDALTAWILSVMGDALLPKLLVGVVGVMGMVVFIFACDEVYDWYIWRDAMRLRRQLYRLRQGFHALSTP